MTTTINASTSAGLVQSADTSGILQLQTANTAALTIDSSQNVGIGTASPASRLHISGGDVRGSNAADTLRLLGGTSGTANNIQIRGASHPSTPNIITFDTNSAESMRIDSSGIITGTAGNLMLVSGTAVASTSGTSINFTGIPSWVKRITVMFSGVSLSGTTDFLIQIGSGSISSSGYVSTSNATNAGAATTGLSSTAGFIVIMGTASHTMSGQMVLTNISANSWVSSHTAKETTTRVIMGGGDVTLGGVLDRVRITTVNGTDTFDAGSINILYE